ncbi:MAG: Asp23/Gls24 family envelope stress response protein [Candidatus Sumerlaeia bacterium]|nr:Asp23/Gls24 family envelope stress response protein [Candidatus Sumerlaeia bacterium]
MATMTDERPQETAEHPSNLPIRYGDESSGEILGDIKISNEVVGTIASLAASDVEGIVGLVSKFSLGDMLGRKDTDRGVVVTIENTRVSVHVEVNVQYGVNIYDVCHRLQRKIKDSVEEMTGLVVDRVNVDVRGIVVPPRENKER